MTAAEEVFAAKGFEGASTREIAAAAGVNISSLHYHWESKETLYVAVFENIYDRIVELVHGSIPEASAERPAHRQVVDDSVGLLFDFFADQPNIPKLLVRRLLESTEGTSAIERDILLPAWERFANLTQDLSKVDQMDAPIFMLTVHSVMLLFMLDSQQFGSLLGGSVRTPALRARLRPHIINLVHVLLRAERARKP
ncbi:MAG: TetR/AcrR family transcriptional regulator [Candidatus Binatia bacterium]